MCVYVCVFERVWGEKEREGKGKGMRVSLHVCLSTSCQLRLEYHLTSTDYIVQIYRLESFRFLTLLFLISFTFFAFTSLCQFLSYRYNHVHTEIHILHKHIKPSNSDPLSVLYFLFVPVISDSNGGQTHYFNADKYSLSPIVLLFVIYTKGWWG